MFRYSQWHSFNRDVHIENQSLSKRLWMLCCMWSNWIFCIGIQVGAICTSLLSINTFFVICSATCYCPTSAFNISSLANSFNCNLISLQQWGETYSSSMMGNTSTSFALHERAPIPYINENFPSVQPFFSVGCYASRTGIAKRAIGISAYKCAHLCNGTAGTFFGLQNGLSTTIQH